MAFFGSIVLEYGTSWALEKLFHAYWWDYSSMPLNINGRVCFPYSVGFGVAGLIVVYFIAPFTKLITGWMSPIWYEFFSLLLMGLLAVDTAITVSALTDFSRTIVNLQNNFNTYMDEVVEEVKERKKAADERSQERSQELVVVPVVTDAEEQQVLPRFIQRSPSRHAELKCRREMHRQSVRSSVCSAEKKSAI